MFGVHGRYLRVDVGNATSRAVEIPEAVCRQFLGGVGLGTWILHQELPAGLDALDPKAVVIFSFSPLVGTPLTTSAKFAVVTKSPLTNRLNDSLSSSHFAIAGKRTGFDAIVLTGRAARPSVLIIDDGSIRVEDADNIWGSPTSEATARLQDRYGPECQSAVIGPAGEQLVRFATVSHDNRHAGRGGHGAVLGSKNLKAVLVRGTHRVEVANPEAVILASRDLAKRSQGAATEKYRELGTIANLLTLNRLNALPTRNFQTGSFEGAEAIRGEAFIESQRVARKSCASCTIGCEHIFATTGGNVRLEYESLFALGSLCGIADRDAILNAARLCDELGIDTISAGATVAFAMECSERGLIDVDLRFGDAEGLLRALPAIARREGVFRLLGEGTRIAAQAIGGDAPDFAPHVKGLEIPGYEPRALQTMALGFAVGSRGADHNRSGAYEADFSSHSDRLHGSASSAALAVETEDRAALIDSLILCKFLRGVFEEIYADSAELLRHVTGWEVTGDELRETAQRIVALKKLFNEREGWTRAEDTLPKRMLRDPLPSGASPGAALTEMQLGTMIETYYRARGWNEDGLMPTAEIERMKLTGLILKGAG